MIVKKIQVVTSNSGNGNSTTITGKNHGAIIPVFGWKRPKMPDIIPHLASTQTKGNLPVMVDCGGWLWGFPHGVVGRFFSCFFPLGRLGPPSPDTSDHRGTFVATEDLRLGQNSMQFFGGWKYGTLNIKIMLTSSRRIHFECKLFIFRLTFWHRCFKVSLAVRQRPACPAHAISCHVILNTPLLAVPQWCSDKPKTYIIVTENG